MIEEINEPISVIALFEKGTVRPYRIKWRDRVYQVKKVHSKWRQKVGATYHIHLAVSIDDDMSMQLAVDTSDLSWRLERVDLPG